MYKITDIDDYKSRITEKQAEKLINHCNRYNIKPIICAWYDDWDDFCSDWCDGLGYTRTKARKILHGGKGEFVIFSTGEIVRLEM